VGGRKQQLKDRASTLTKRYDEQIDVTPDPIDADAPLTFLWRGRRYQVDQRLESWREGGEWWRAAGGADGNGSKGRAAAGRLGGTPRVREREFYRVLAHPSSASASGDLDPDGFLVRDDYLAVYDLYRDRVNDVWKLARVWD
jgi:hypothetical protein